jgi:hypothetical protein
MAGVLGVGEGLLTRAIDSPLRRRDAEI